MVGRLARGTLDVFIPMGNQEIITWDITHESETWKRKDNDRERSKDDEVRENRCSEISPISHQSNLMMRRFQPIFRSLLAILFHRLVNRIPLHQCLRRCNRAVEVLIEQHVGIQRERALGDECCRHDDDPDDGKLNTGEVAHRAVDVTIVLRRNAIDVLPDQRVGDGVDDDISRVQKRHH